jgi:hypothetical protein
VAEKESVQRRVGSKLVERMTVVVRGSVQRMGAEEATTLRGDNM